MIAKDRGPGLRLFGFALAAALRARPASRCAGRRSAKIQTAASGAANGPVRQAAKPKNNGSPR